MRPRPPPGCSAGGRRCTGRPKCRSSSPALPGFRWNGPLWGRSGGGGAVGGGLGAPARRRGGERPLPPPPFDRARMKILSVVSRGYYGQKNTVEPMYIAFTEPLRALGHDVEHFD